MIVVVEGIRLTNGERPLPPRADMGGFVAFSCDENDIRLHALCRQRKRPENMAEILASAVLEPGR